MSIKKDWMERQIEAISNTFAAILFGKDKVKSILEMDEEEDAATQMEDDILERMTKKYLSEKNFNEAENLIFNALEKEKTIRRFELALNFFNEAHQFSDELLSKCNYSHKEIEEGINYLKKLYDLKLYL